MTIRETTQVVQQDDVSKVVLSISPPDQHTDLNYLTFTRTTKNLCTGEVYDRILTKLFLTDRQLLDLAKTIAAVL